MTVSKQRTKSTTVSFIYTHIYPYTPPLSKESPKLLEGEDVPIPAL